MKRRARLIGIAPVLGEWRMGPVEKISEQRLAVLSFQNRNQRAWTALIISSKGAPAYKKSPLFLSTPRLPPSTSLYKNYNWINIFLKLVVRSMQECFRRHPDHYGSELDDGEGQEEDAANAATSPPQVDEASTSPVLDRASPQDPEVDEPSVPLFQSKNPSSASPQVDEPSVTSSISEGPPQATSDLSRRNTVEDSASTKGQDRGLRNLEPSQPEGGDKVVPGTKHD